MQSLTSLAEEALAQAKRLDGYLLSQGRQYTSFEEDTLSHLPPELVEARETLINSAQTLKKLALRPESVFEEMMWACADQISLSAINEFHLADYVPYTETTTFGDIASSSGLPEQLVERLLRHAMTNHIFTENETGHVQHTALSRLLATDANLSETIAMMTQETWQVSTTTTDAIEMHPKCQEPSEAAFTLINEPGVPMFEFLARHPEREQRFGGAMRYYASLESWDLKHLINGYPWSCVDRPEAILVDVGGGQGWVCRALAKATSNIKFIVQYLEGTVKDGRRLLPQELSHRVQFMQHDFFTQQPVKMADVYFLRWVLRDWSDKYAVMILRSLVPALKDGARIILYERVLFDGAETRLTEKYGRNADLIILAQFNGRERTAKAFETLFRGADPRYRVAATHRPAGSAMAIIEIIWKSDA